MIRKAGLFLVMLGALSLSFFGQMAAVTPLLGHELAIVFALTNDIAALLALNEVVTASASGVRAWGWVALWLSGGTALGLNTWHAIQAAVLPVPAAIVAGAQPVVLAWVLSHVVALVVGTPRHTPTATASESASEPVSKTESGPTSSVTVEAETNLEATPSPSVSEAEESAAGSVSVPAHPALSSVADLERETVAETTVEPVREALPAAPQRGEDSLPVRLIDQAEKLDRQALAESNGKRGLPYREAPRRLGVRYDTARAALDAARARRKSRTEPAQRHEAA